VVKVGGGTLRFDAAQNPLSRAEAEAYLVHEDGFLRVPVLVVGDLIVRGYRRRSTARRWARRAREEPPP